MLSRQLKLMSSVILSATLLSLLPGCGGGSGDSGNGSGAKSEGFELDWGSGSVKIGEDGSVDVKAPGVDVQRKAGESVRVRTENVNVDVDREDGVQVKTPSTEVDASMQRGVKVDSPGVNVDTKWGSDDAAGR